MKMKSTAIAIFSLLLLSLRGHCEEEEEGGSERAMDSKTVQNFITQLVGLLNQGTSGLVGGNGLNGIQDVDGYQRPLPDLSGLDLDNRPVYNRPYRPNFGRPGAPGRPGLFSGSDQQGQIGNLLGLLGQGGQLGQGGLFGQGGQFGQGQLGQFGGQSNFGGLGQFGQNGIDAPVPYPYPARPPTQRPYPIGPGSYEQQSLFGALYSIAQYDDLRCVPRLLCEVTAGSRPGGPYYPSYGQNQQTSIVPFLSKDSLVTILTVLNFVDESPILTFGRAALLGYTTRGDPRQCLTAYPLCPRNPDQLVNYLNNHNGGFFRFFNQQLPHIPQYAPYYQSNYQSSLQGGLQGAGLYNKLPYRKFKKFTKLYDTENSKKLPAQYAVKNQKYYKEPRILYGKETDNKITFDTLPQDDFVFRPGGESVRGESVRGDGGETFRGESFREDSQRGDFKGHRGGKKLKFQDDTVQTSSGGSGQDVSHSNAYQTFFPSESQNSHTFSFPSVEDRPSKYPHRNPKTMTFPDKTGTGNLVLEVDKYGNYVVRKDREEPLLESAHKIRFQDFADYDQQNQQYYNRYKKRESKRLYFPEDDKSYIY